MSLPDAVQRLHASGVTGEGVTIGHLDTGLDPQVARIPPSTTQDFRIFDDFGRPVVVAPQDSAMHGSITAGVIHQLAPGAKLVSGAVFDGGHVYARLLAGMNWLAERSVDIVLLAFGVPNKTTVFERTLEVLVGGNALCIAPSGNNGTGTMRSPGWSPHVLTVGAVGESGLPEVYSGCIELDHGGVRKPEILAQSSTADETGTSIASAYVAGLAALLRQAMPHSTPASLKRAFATSCTPLTAMAYKAQYGVIDAEKIADLCARPPAGSDAGDSQLSIRYEALRPEKTWRARRYHQAEGEFVYTLIFLEQGTDVTRFQRTLPEKCDVIWALTSQGILFCKATAQQVESLVEHEHVEMLHSTTL